MVRMVTALRQTKKQRFSCLEYIRNMASLRMYSMEREIWPVDAVTFLML